jgi:S-formylglutathione hydrolase FrmB
MAVKVTRRRVLVGGAATIAAAGAGAVATGLVAPRVVLNRVLGNCGDDGRIPAKSASVIVDGELTSAHVRDPAGWTIAWPPSLEPGQPAAVCVCLHPRGSNHRNATDSIHLHDFVAEAATAGVTPFAIAAIDGGDRYWHPRTDGNDPLALLLDDFLPFLAAQHGLGGDQHSTAIAGWSMGGYGALLAAETAPERFAAVVAAGPAITRTRGGLPDDAFDGDADFAAHDVFAGAQRLRSVKVRIDCGSADPFSDAARDFARSLDPPPATDFSKGCHDSNYWRRVAPDEVRFLAAALNGR